MQCINQSIESYHEKKAHQFAILESARAICRLEDEIRGRLKKKENIKRHVKSEARSPSSLSRVYKYRSFRLILAHTPET